MVGGVSFARGRRLLALPPNGWPPGFPDLLLLGAFSLSLELSSRRSYFARRPNVSLEEKVEEKDLIGKPEKMGQVTLVAGSDGTASGVVTGAASWWRTAATFPPQPSSRPVDPPS